MYKIIDTHMGQIYQGFDYPENIENLDRELVVRTLAYYDFIAEMSDDYNRTLSEKRVVQNYRTKHHLD